MSEEKLLKPIHLYPFSKEKGKTKSYHEILGLWQRSFRLHDVVTSAVYVPVNMINQSLPISQDSPQPVA